MDENIIPYMSAAKIQLLIESFSRTRHYLEYGIGGSTVLASKNNLQSIIAIDSSVHWINKVKSEIENSDYRGNINLLLADLGETGEWGYPKNESSMRNWPSYYSHPWSVFQSMNKSPDLILIDGRFRAPCFLYSLLNCNPGTRILWDDYMNRPEYHFVEVLLQPEGLIDDMAIFTTDSSLDKSLALTLIFNNLFNLD